MKYVIGYRKFLLWKSLCIIFIFASYIDLVGQNIKGVVVCNGKGVENVVVSNGYSVSTTDSKGKYVLTQSNGNKFVFISTPSGYQLNVRDGIPSFYQTIEVNKTNGYDFELFSLKEDDSKHAFMVHADAQILKDKEFNLYQLAIDDCKQLIDNHPYKNNFFGIDCGDLVADKHSLYPEYISKLSQLEIPFFRVIGNHDLDYTNRSNHNSNLTFENTFGPSYYSFNRGKAHYVVLNDVFYLGHQYYYMGYIEEKMLKWLERDLDNVVEGSLVFVALHIPTSITEGKYVFNYSNLGKGVSNREALYHLLEPYKAHILSGHEHCNQNLVYSPNLREHVNASVSGAWWQGPVCTDGTPCGYKVFEVIGDSVSWYYKSIGFDKSFQFKLYPIGADEKYKDSFVVNVWNCDEDWKIEWFEDNQKMGVMKRYEGHDPDVKVIYSDKDKLDYKWIGPTLTSHLFRAIPVNPDAVIEVRVTDSFGKIYTANLNN